jgi:hypothetical protein
MAASRSLNEPVVMVIFVGGCAAREDVARIALSSMSTRTEIFFLILKAILVRRPQLGND